MKVLLVGPTLRVGGGRTYLIQLSRVIRERGDGESWVFWVPAELEGVLGPPAGACVYYEPEDTGRGFHDLLGNWTKRRRDRARLRELIRDHSPNVVFVASEFGYASLGVPQALLVRNRIYYDADWLRGVQSRGKRANILLRRWLASRAIRSADHLIYPSLAMARAVTDFLQPTAPWTVAHYGAPQASRLERPARSPGQPLRLLNIANYYPQKNLGMLLEAVRILVTRGVPVRLTLTGEPDEVWGDRAREDRALLQGLGPAADLHANVSYAEALALYRDADVFVFPSTCESFGHPLLEAMAHRVPVVAADTAVNRELCGTHARYFAADDPPALADLLECMAAGELPAPDPSAVLERFTWEAHLDSLYRVFGELARPAADR